ncbi:RluA family pseudouridine synthase [Marinibactrum halimedae]|uniref:Ribosomal large subunit pseudouridine synthase A n=1 Tax=Marinibactrum halimedae TaxID=1444977 RepID=A0AA37TC93_9GAMM|nr:RluA family pseudouridine synthase [Marinibactrum halimedae]MCD9460101.1 RluA family pseudouridine synthase [Marinibactrum halimedae]GLS26502.1 ribosomal large subunit pseudouridine synthase A [Marinibactrum halimedae]
MTDIEVLFSDRHFLVANKPHDLLSVPGKGPDKQDCLIQRLLPNFPNSRAVHRLDMPTSGLMLVAQSHQSLQHLSAQFQNRTVLKRYVATVYGIVQSEQGSVEAPMRCDWPNRPKQMIAEDGKPALTHYQVLSRDPVNNVTRVALFPHTGRSHQLRVHMMSIGHPIIGDPFYACKEARSLAERLHLHAEYLCIRHPITQCLMTFTAKAPF